MSVVVIVRFPGGRLDRWKEVYADNAETMRKIAVEARGKGAIHHAFVEDENGDVMVVDEWSSMAEFEAFFATQDEIKAVMGQIGMTGPPTTVSYAVQDTPDRF